MNAFYFNVSLHDITPAREQEARTLLSLCESCGITRGTLLVVPNFHGQYPLRQHPLAQWLQTLARNGWEIALHGQEHLMSEPTRLTLLQRLIAHHYTDREGEFFLLSGEDARRRLTQGLAMLKECGLQPSGFVAPAWLMSRETVQVLAQLPLSFATTLDRVYDLKNGRRRFAPVQAFSSRSPDRILASAVSGWLAGYLWKGLPFVRVALHPSDLASPLIMRTAERLLRRLARQRACLLFEEYLNLQASRP